MRRHCPVPPPLGMHVHCPAQPCGTMQSCAAMHMLCSVLLQYNLRCHAHALRCTGCSTSCTTMHMLCSALLCTAAVHPAMPGPAGRSLQDGGRSALPAVVHRFAWGRQKIPVGWSVWVRLAGGGQVAGGKVCTVQHGVEAEHMPAARPIPAAGPGGFPHLATAHPAPSPTSLPMHPSTSTACSHSPQATEPLSAIAALPARLVSTLPCPICSRVPHSLPASTFPIPAAASAPGAVAAAAAADHAWRRRLCEALSLQGITLVSRYRGKQVGVEPVLAYYSACLLLFANSVNWGK